MIRNRLHAYNTLIHNIEWTITSLTRTTSLQIPTTVFATRQDIRLPSVAAHRKVNHDLRKALAHVASDSVKMAAKSQGLNMVTFEEDEKENDGRSCTKTCPCNIQRFLSAVKFENFQLKF